VKLTKGCSYNLPMSITTNVSCPVANCAVDLGPICPEVLRGPFDATGFALGCKTSCFANLDGHPGARVSHVGFYVESLKLREDDSPNCCSGSFNKPETCPVQGIRECIERDKEATLRHCGRVLQLFQGSLSQRLRASSWLRANYVVLTRASQAYAYDESSGTALW